MVKTIASLEPFVPAHLSVLTKHWTAIFVLKKGFFQTWKKCFRRKDSPGWHRQTEVTPQYNYRYRSALATPFVEPNLGQHMITVGLEFAVGGIPFR
ncbi:MAG: hypothetical protein ACTHLE_15430 [Agriterribacter sp.]